MIAIGVLGIGLIMVAAIFPVALTQHKDSIEKSRSLDMLDKAAALIAARIDAGNLWVATPPAAMMANPPADDVKPGADSPWYMLPTSNLPVNGTVWDRMPANSPLFSPLEPSGLVEYGIYSNCLNLCRNANTYGFSDSGQRGNAYSWFAIPSLELLSDRKAPLNDSLSPMDDAAFQSIENRFAWVGFYRKMAGGSTRSAVAVNRILRNERYAEQDMMSLGSGGPGFMPQGGGNSLRRLPVPWRVTVGYDPNTKRLFNTANPEGLGELAPPGSKIMVGGFVWRNALVLPPAPAMPIAPAGRILTVTNVYDNTNDGTENPNLVDFLEDPAGLPTFDALNDPADQQYFFDVIVFPPPVVDIIGGNLRFGRKSPLIQWKVNL